MHVFDVTRYRIEISKYQFSINVDVIQITCMSHLIQACIHISYILIWYVSDLMTTFSLMQRVRQIRIILYCEVAGTVWWQKLFCCGASQGVIPLPLLTPFVRVHTCCYHSVDQFQYPPQLQAQKRVCLVGEMFLCHKPAGGELHPKNQKIVRVLKPRLSCSLESQARRILQQGVTEPRRPLKFFRRCEEFCGRPVLEVCLRHAWTCTAKIFVLAQ
jgi:hypothetical protein